jgi:hypothetical protein
MRSMKAKHIIAIIAIIAMRTPNAETTRALILTLTAP